MDPLSRRLCLVFLLFTSGLAGAISVGPGGTGVNTFDTHPAVGDWSTASIGTQGPGAYASPGALLIRALQLNAADINQPLGSSSALPPSPAPLARRNTEGGYLQTRPENNDFTVLMATLRNDTGVNATTLTVSYIMGQAILAEDIIEEIPGYLASYSLTGLPGSWRAIPAMTTSSSGPVTATINLAGWAPGAILYLAWLDDNGSGGSTALDHEAAFTLDDFQAFAFGPRLPRPDVQRTPHLAIDLRRQHGRLRLRRPGRDDLSVAAQRR